MKLEAAKPSPAAALSGLKRILVAVPVRVTLTETPAALLAIKLAAEHGASLSFYILSPSPEPPPMSIDGSASAWLRHEQARFDGEISKASSAAIRLAALAGVDFVVACAKSPFEERDEPFLKLARTNDLSVVDAADAGNPVQRRLAEDILFESGRPVLVVPAVGSADLPRRIAIAWDGSAGAARAVGDALPFLRLADTVVAVTVTGEKDLSHMALGADLASYLAAHGVPHCKLANLSARSSDVGARLRLFVAEEDIDWIVMGAFVHSRFRQAILGGVTRSMLDEVSVPLFMSH